MNTFFTISLFICSLTFHPIYQGVQDTVYFKGTVTAFKKYSLNNVIIKSIGNNTIVRTDEEGHFSYSCRPGSVTYISAFGFESKKIKPKNNKTVKIDLSFINDETSFKAAIENNHIAPDILLKALRDLPKKSQKDYSKYTSIFQLIRVEVPQVKVIGTSVYSNLVQSLTLSPQVLYDVDGIIVTSISNILPVEVKSIKYVTGVGATRYGVRGANGIIVITRKK